MGLLKSGLFRGGLVLVLFGVAAFVAISYMPQARTPEDIIANAKLIGQIGGGMIGVGLVAMVTGIPRRGQVNARQGRVRTSRRPA